MDDNSTQKRLQASLEAQTETLRRYGPDREELPETSYMSPMGLSGLARSSQDIYEDTAYEMQGAQAGRVYKEMLDSHGPLAGAVLLINSLLSGAAWEVQPSEFDTMGIAGFVETCFKDLDVPWSRIRSDAFLSMVVFGASFQEIMIKPRRSENGSRYNDGKFGWSDIAIRGWETIDEFVWSGDYVEGIYQTTKDGKRLYIPMEKIVHTVTPNTIDRNPRGRSWLRGSVEAYRFLRMATRMEAIGIERNLSGLPYMTVPPEYLIDPDAQARASLKHFETIVRKVRLDEMQGLVLPAETDPATGLPTGFKFEVLSTGNNPSQANPTILRLRADVLTSLLSEVIVLGSSEVGARALGDSKIDTLQKALKITTDFYAESFTRSAIHKICKNQ